jgi:hypothetical protein
MQMRSTRLSFLCMIWCFLIGKLVHFMHEIIVRWVDRGRRLEYRVFREWGKEGGVSSSLCTHTIYFTTSHCIYIVERSQRIIVLSSGTCSYWLLPFHHSFAKSCCNLHF